MNMKDKAKAFLSAGAHENGGGTCLMEYVSLVKDTNNGVKTDYPKGIDRMLSRAMQRINDYAEDWDRQSLLGLVDRISTCTIELTPQQTHTLDLYSLDPYGSSALQRATAILDRYDELVGSSWRDRPVMDVPPLMAELDQERVNAVAEPYEMTGRWGEPIYDEVADFVYDGPLPSSYVSPEAKKAIGSLIGFVPVMADYKPSFKVKIASKVGIKSPRILAKL